MLVKLSRVSIVRVAPSLVVAVDVRNVVLNDKDVGIANVVDWLVNIASHVQSISHGAHIAGPVSNAEKFKFADIVGSMRFIPAEDVQCVGLRCSHADTVSVRLNHCVVTVLVRFVPAVRTARLVMALATAEDTARLVTSMVEGGARSAPRNRPNSTNTRNTGRVKMTTEQTGEQTANSVLSFPSWRGGKKRVTP